MPAGEWPDGSFSHLLVLSMVIGSSAPSNTLPAPASPEMSPVKRVTAGPEEGTRNARIDPFRLTSSRGVVMASGAPPVNPRSSPEGPSKKRRYLAGGPSRVSPCRTSHRPITRAIGLPSAVDTSSDDPPDESTILRVHRKAERAAVESDVMHRERR